jgi:hypothetical protein
MAAFDKVRRLAWRTTTIPLVTPVGAGISLKKKESRSATILAHGVKKTGPIWSNIGYSLDRIWRTNSKWQTFSSVHLGQLKRRCLFGSIAQPATVNCVGK